MKNVAKSLMILLILTAPLKLNAQPIKRQNSEVNECIKRCQRALNAADKTIESLQDITVKQDELIDALESDNVRLNRALNEEIEKSEAWYRQPTTTVLGGVVLGILAAGLIGASR